jgi:DivIVA domain-containing protein
MTIFLVLIAILAVGATAFFAVGREWQGRGQAPPRDQPTLSGLVEPTPNLPPVLLPDRPAPSDIARIRFSLGLRGYRMDQVEEVLDRLAAALAERDALIEALQDRNQDRNAG